MTRRCWVGWTPFVSCLAMPPPVTRRAHSMRRLSGAEPGTDTVHNDTRFGTPSDRQEGNGPGSTGGHAHLLYGPVSHGCAHAFKGGCWALFTGLPEAPSTGLLEALSTDLSACIQALPSSSSAALTLPPTLESSCGRSCHSPAYLRGSRAPLEYGAFNQSLLSWERSSSWPRMPCELWLVVLSGR